MAANRAAPEESRGDPINYSDTDAAAFRQAQPTMPIHTRTKVSLSPATTDRLRPG
jgi:hypothetical protein